MLEPSEGQFSGTTATAILLGEIANLEKRSGKELDWFRRHIPQCVDEVLLRQRMRVLRAIEALGLWTESAFAAAQLDGAYLSHLQKPATGTAGVGEARAPEKPPVGAPPPPVSDFSAAEEAVLDAVLFVAAIDGEVVPAEISVAKETLRRLFATASTDALAQRIAARPIPSTLRIERIDAALSPSQRQLFLMQLAEVASSGLDRPRVSQLLGSC